MDIPTAGLLRRIEIALVDGKGVNALVVPEDKRGAVSLVQVAVDDSYPHPFFLALDLPHGDRHVVDVAKSFGMIRKGVVETAGKVHRAPSSQGLLAGPYGPAGNQERGANNLL